MTVRRRLARRFALALALVGGVAEAQVCAVPVVDHLDVVAVTWTGHPPPTAAPVRPGFPYDHPILPARGRPPLTVEACGVPVVVTLAPGRRAAIRRAPAAVEATAPIAFRGTASFYDWEFTNRDAMVVDGMVSLGARSRMSLRRTVRDAAHMDVESLVGTIHDLPVPCGALTHVDHAGGYGEIGPAADASDGTQWWAVGGNVTFREAPAAGRSVRMSGAFWLERLERSGEWWRMRTEDLLHGVRVVGWVSRRSLRGSDPPIGMGNWGTAGNGSGVGTWRFPIGADDFYGTARLSDGAAIYAQPGRAPWATVRGAVVGRVLIARDAPWAYVFDVRDPEGADRGSFGLPPAYAYMRREDIQLLEAAPGSDSGGSWSGCRGPGARVRVVP